MLDKEKIIKSYTGDLNWLEEIERQTKLYLAENENFEEIKKMLNLLFKMNYIIMEAETEKYAGKYHTELYDVYAKMKIDLTKMIGFEDFWEIIYLGKEINRG